MAYYNQSDLQPVHAADAWNLDRYLFTALAYIARAGKKNGSRYDEDVCKAIWFLAYAVTGCADTAEKCKGLVLKRYELREKEADNTSIKLSRHASSEANSGDVSEYRELRGEEESELVRERSHRALYGPSADYS